MGKQEFFNGGLVTSRDRSLLAEGELSRAEDVIYFPNDVGIHRAPGRAKFNSNTLTYSISGLQYCAFDSPDPDRLVAQIYNAYKIAPAGNTGEFVQLAATTAGSSFEAIHYRNRHVLINGVGDNKVLLRDGTLREHGLLPTTTTPSCTVDTGGTGLWPLGAGSVPNYYEYWTTEAIINDEERIESTFQGTPKAVFVNSSTDFVTILPPTKVNDTATHWVVYRSVSKSVDVGLAFPNGFKIAEVAFTSEDAFTDGKKATSAAIFPGATQDLSSFFFTPGTITDGIAWTNLSRITASDNSRATGTSTRSGSAPKFHYINPVGVAKTFTFVGIGSIISSVNVIIEGYHSAANGVVVAAISTDAGTTWTAAAQGTLGIVADGTITLGGLWGRGWSQADFNSTTFWVLIYCTHFGLGGTVDHNIDSVSVTVTSGGTTADQSVAFPSLLPLAAVGRHGKGPKAFTGDIFEESLVTNDVNNPTLISYSTQENIDSFPPTYLLSFQTRDKDTVRCVRALGNTLVVGLYSKLFRVNYLPRESDAEFDRGRAIDLISADHGIVGPRAACVFQMDGQSIALAYVSRYGIHMTDGYRATTLTNDLDWSSTVNFRNLDNCELVNDPSNYQLILFHDGVKHHFYYHPSHLKDGKLKVTGPINYNSNAATNATLDSGALNFYTAKSDGFVYVENLGTVDESGGTISPVVETREIYLAGPGSEWQVQKVLLHSRSTPGMTVGLTPLVAKTNASVREGSLKVKGGIERGFVRYPVNESGEGISFRFAGTGDGEMALNYVVLEGDDLGTEDSLK